MDIACGHCKVLLPRCASCGCVVRLFSYSVSNSGCGGRLQTLALPMFSVEGKRLRSEEALYYRKAGRQHGGLLARCCKGSSAFPPPRAGSGVATRGCLFLGLLLQSSPFPSPSVLLHTGPQEGGSNGLDRADHYLCVSPVYATHPGPVREAPSLFGGGLWAPPMTS